MSSLPLLVLLGVIGPWQVVIIVALILVLFGGKKIPEKAAIIMTNRASPPRSR